MVGSVFSCACNHYIAKQIFIIILHIVKMYIISRHIVPIN